MILLTSTSELIEFTTSSTSKIEYTWSAVDMTSSATTPVSGDGSVSSATTTTIVAAPSASTQRQVKSMTLRNSGSATNVVTLIKDNAASDRILMSVSLLPNECLYYGDSDGFKLFDSSGRIKITPSETSGYNGRTASFFKVGTGADTIGYWYCYAKDSGFPGAFAPGTPGTGGRTTDGTTSTDAGCLLIANPSSGSNYLTQVTVTSTVAHWFMLFDLLWINSGLTVTTTTAQTVNSGTLPARDVNGSTNGEGLMIGLLTTTANTNAAVINNSTVTYTNSAGTGSRTATLSNVVGAQIPVSPAIGTIVWFQLQAGDTGVRSIQSITLGTSLVAGAISLLIARPLWGCAVAVANVGTISMEQNPGVKLYNGTCALWCYQATATTATTTSGIAYIMER